MKVLVTSLLTSAIVIGLLNLVNVNKESSVANAGFVFTQPTTSVVTNMAPAPKTDNESFEGSKTFYHYVPIPDNTVFIMGPIMENSANIAQEISDKSKKNKELFVLINSPGGSVLDGAEIVAAIQASQAHITTVCIQLCASMASIIHAYGHDRAMLDRSILMNHQAALGLEGPIEIVRSRLSTLYRYTQKMDAYIAKRAGLTLEQFNAVFTNEQWIDAEDATAQHFNDKIVHLDMSSFSKETKFQVQESIKKTRLQLKMGEF